MTSVSDPMVGYVLGGRYEITGRIARGGMAMVYLATDTRLSRTVAVKLMHESLGDDADFALKFDREARAAAQLSVHPTIVSVFDQGRDHGRPYIVMEYVEGQTLRTLIAQEGPFPAERALELMEPILCALATAHAHGIVHRDVKPENVLISARGQVKVADFGLAKAMTGEVTASQGMVMGTVSYIPPELVQRGHCDPRSDVYSAGILLFELLTGRKPYVGDSPIQIAYAHCNRDVPAPSVFVPQRGKTGPGSVPGYIDALVQTAASRDPGQRPRDAAAMLHDLRAARVALEHGVREDPRLEAALRHPLTAPADAASDGDVTTNLARPAPETPAPNRWTPRASRPHADKPREERPATSRPTPVSATPNRPKPAVIMPAPPQQKLRKAERRRPPRSGATAATKRRRRGFATLIIVLLLAIAMGLAGWWLAAGKFSTAPSLVGMSRDAALQAAHDDHVATKVVEEYSDTTPAGQVVRTDPSAGSAVFPWTVMQIFTSQGPAPVTVVDYTGAQVSIAEAQLEALGFRVTTKREPSPTVPEGSVITQTPRSGQAHRGDTVTLDVSSGPALVAVPNVLGKSTADATAVLEQAGFKVVTVKKNSVIVLNRVYSTSPAAGTQLEQGSTVTISVI